MANVMQLQRQALKTLASEGRQMAVPLARAGCSQRPCTARPALSSSHAPTMQPASRRGLTVKVAASAAASTSSSGLSIDLRGALVV